MRIVQRKNGLNKAHSYDWEPLFMCKNLVIFHLFSDPKWLFFMYLHRFLNTEIKFLYLNLWFYAYSDAVLLKDKAKVPGGLEVRTSKPWFASESKNTNIQATGYLLAKNGSKCFHEGKNETKLTDFWL